MRPLRFWKYIAYAWLFVATSAFRVAPQEEQSPRRIEIKAMRYSYTPNEITVKKGEPVVLAIRSTDVTHGFWVKDLNILAEIPNGRVTEVPFTPTEIGDFGGQCSHFCGEGHGNMTFTVHVVE